MKTASLTALAAATKAAATLKFQAWVRFSTSLVLLAGTLILCATPKLAFGNLFVAGDVDNHFTIGEYTNSGAPINPMLLTGVPAGSIAVSDGFLYVVNGLGTIGKYTTAGATVDASLISGLQNPYDIAVSGGDLYVVEHGDSQTGLGGRVGKYTTSGTTINASLITGLLLPQALAVSGNRLFVDDGEMRMIGEYTTSGSAVNASMIILSDSSVNDLEVAGSNLFISYNQADDALVGKYNVDGTVVDPMLICCPDSAGDLAISGSDLYFIGGDMVGKYTTSGIFVANPLIPGVTFPTAIAVDGSATVPETLSTLWFGLAIAGLLGFARFLRVHHGRSSQMVRVDTDNFDRLVGIEILAPDDIKSGLRKCANA